MFKQFLESGAMNICQIDSCRLGSINEIITVLLMAHKFNVPVFPHAGGVGLCEYVQHLCMIDYVLINGSKDDKVVETMVGVQDPAILTGKFQLYAPLDFSDEG